MNKVNLIEISAVVFAVLVCSASVQAEGELKEMVKEKEVVAKEKMSEQSAKADELISSEKLFAPLDRDNNGVISEQELGMTTNKMLKKQFDKIDTNADKGISEEELKSFLAKIDVKDRF